MTKKDKAIKWFTMLREKFTGTEYGEYLDMAIKALEQEPKTGRWKRISMGKYVQHAMAYYRCSECDKNIIGTHNYCPFCGAKMQNVQESVDKE